MPKIHRPLTEESVRRLVRLKGDYRPPILRIWLSRAVAFALMLAALILFYSLFLRRHDLMMQVGFTNLTRSVRFASSAAMGLICFWIGFRTYKKAGQWYRFASGRLQLFSAAGSGIWDEDLSTTVGGSITYGEGPYGFLELAWKHSNRKIEITAELANAIRALESENAAGATE